MAEETSEAAETRREWLAHDETARLLKRLRATRLKVVRETILACASSTDPAVRFLSGRFAQLDADCIVFGGLPFMKDDNDET